VSADWPRSGSAHRRALIGALLLAFGLRAGWVGLASLDPSDGEYFDMVWYHLTAARIAEGQGVTRIDGTPTAVWPPLYPALLAPVYKLAGASLAAGRLVNAVLGALTTFFVWGIARRLAGARAGLVAAFLFAACPDEIFFANFVMSECAYVTFAAGTAWLFVRLDGRRPAAGAGAWVGLGVAAGLATLVRGVGLLWLALPLAIWSLRERALRPLLVRAAPALLGLACALAPWMLRNAVQLGAPVLATSLGRTLAHAHSPFETGGPSLETLVYRNRIQKRFEHLPQPRMEVELNRAYTRLSLEYMLTHPGHELRVLPNRVRHLFGHGHLGLEIGRPKLPGGAPKPFFSAGAHALLAGAADALFYALLVCGALGTPRLLRDPQRTAWVVPGSVAYFALLHLLVFPADPRFHLPMLPFLAVSAAALLAGGRPRAGAPAQAAAGGV
jgi:4-amino-4-deoxy-L-arabinose transferase-like glycosyltransferase